MHLARFCTMPHISLPLLFLDLPVEIRLQIYKYLIESFNWGPKIHLLLTSQPNPLYPPSLGSGHLSYTRCRYPNGAPAPHITSTMDLFRWRTHYETCRGWRVRNGTPPALQGTYLSIFLTCKTMYFLSSFSLLPNLLA